MSGLFGLARPFLHALDAETAHGLTISALKTGLVPLAAPAPERALAQGVFGLDIASPVGIAAGFDKNAEVADAMLAMGFGFAEVGTVTPEPQAGNPRPRLFRLRQDRAVINRMGFNNDGHAAVRARLEARRGKGGIVGVNIGANKASADRIADYVRGLETFHDIASYLAVNISSPNTPGLRGLQSRAELQRLVERLTAARSALASTTPLLLKIAPDLGDGELADIAAVCLDGGIDGLIVSNTTVARPPLRSPERGEPGGLSGEPLFHPSTVVLAKMYRLTGGRLPLIGVGGVSSGATAWEKFRAGASLVQLYSALVYDGPGLVLRIRDHLAARLAREGLAALAQLTGSGAAEWAGAEQPMPVPETPGGRAPADAPRG